MRRPGYPRDPATRVNGVAGVTGYPARMLSPATRPFPPFSLPRLTPLSSQCVSRSHYSVSIQRTISSCFCYCSNVFEYVWACLNMFERVRICLNVFEDAWKLSKGGSRFWITLERMNRSPVRQGLLFEWRLFGLDYWWWESRGRVGRSRRNFEIDEGFGNLISVLWSLLACMLRS